MDISSESTSKEATLEGMHHCLKSIMCSKLLVDVVKMIPKRLRADTKRFGNSRGRDTHRRHFEDFNLLRGEGRLRGSLLWEPMDLAAATTANTSVTTLRSMRNQLSQLPCPN